MKKIAVSVGVFAHNEEKNIEKLLESLERQQLDMVEIAEVIVVSSGSFDRTNTIVRKWERKNPKIRLHEEVTRRGKSAAINEFLEQAASEIVVTISSDLLLSETAIEEIGNVFYNEDVGMVGGHPKPLITETSSVGDEIELLWELHHLVSLIKPKCGEMVAFRNIIRQIPHDSAVDEATIEVLLTMIGYEVVYAPRAVVYNHGPQSFLEFLQQRRRVFTGHQWVSEKYNYQVSTMQVLPIIHVVTGLLVREPTKMWPLIRLVGMEVAARVLGWVDYYVFGKNPYVWKMISR